jgi:hypothetical protein
MMWSAIPATSPMSWVMKIIAMPVSRRSSASSAMICACTVTSSAVVGSSAISRRGLQASAMAIITRCSMPPESWCGSNISAAALGIGNPHPFERFACRRVACAPTSPRLQAEGLLDLRADVSAPG